MLRALDMVVGLSTFEGLSNCFSKSFGGKKVANRLGNLQENEDAIYLNLFFHLENYMSSVYHFFSLYISTDFTFCMVCKVIRMY